MPKISRYVAVGKDEQILKWICEHLPYAFVTVTTPDALLAQCREEGKDALFLVDEGIGPEMEKLLSGCPRQVWLAKGPAAAGKGRILAKPVRLSDLKNTISRLAEEGEGPLPLSPSSRFCTQEQKITGPKGDISLTEREMALLSYLAAQRGNPVPRDELFKNIWGFSTELDTHTLETHIYRLRGKLAEAGENPAILETIEGGYRLV